MPTRPRSARPSLRARLARVPVVTRALAILLVALLAVLAAALAFLRPEAPGREITLDRLARAVTEQRIAEATFLDQDDRVVGLLRDGGRFWAAHPSDDASASRLVAHLTEAGARVSVDAQGVKATVRLLATTLLPLVVLATLFALFFTGAGGNAGIGDVVDFSRLSKDAATPGSVTFDDVAGVEEARVELGEVVDYLRGPDRYAALRAVPPKGVLLLGPPGCGKTLLAKALAGEARVPFFSVAGAEFVESLVGVGAARVRDLFARVRAAAPAIVFIDEIDAAGRRRGGGSGGGSEERDQTLNQLLVEMDGFDVSSGIVVVAATNRPDILDPALLRPGRFDRHVVVDRPDRERREAILRLHARGRPLSAEVDFAGFARRTPGFTGADLANVLNEAALLAVRANRAEIDGTCLSEAVQRVLAGPQRRGHLLSDEERRRLAYHEAGHAVAAAALGRRADVHRVSIVARGRGLGGTGLHREEDAVVCTAAQLQARLVIGLAGRAAETLVFQEPSTGGEDDLEAATALAREMVGRYGMSEAIGLATVLGEDDYLGSRAAPVGISEATHAALDAEVRRLLDEASTLARSHLDRHRSYLDGLADVLLAEESVEGPALGAWLPSPLGDGARRARVARS